MKKEYSVFDIVGPRMIGPSSSHTAGAVRMAHVARHVAHNDISEVKFTLYGSFAETGKGHGTDKALVAGILGMEPDDINVRNSFELAREQGILVDVEFSDEPSEYPNTAKIEIVGTKGDFTQVTGVSIGGGNILITEINGLGVEVTCEYPTIVIRHVDAPGVIAQISAVLAEMQVNVANMRVFRHERGQDSYMTVESDTKITEEMAKEMQKLCPSILEYRIV